MSVDYHVKVVYDAKAELGEGPCYDPATNELVWVDIHGKTINFFALSTGTNRQLQMSDYVGAAVPCKNPEKLIASIGRKICFVNRATGKNLIMYCIHLRVLQVKWKSYAL